MIKKLLKPLKNNRGNGYPLAVAITLILIMIFTGISEYFRLMIVAEGVRDAMQDRSLPQSPKTMMMFIMGCVRGILADTSQ